MSRTRTLKPGDTVQIGDVHVVVTDADSDQIRLAQVPRPGRQRVSRYEGSPDVSLVMRLDSYQGRTEPVWITAVGTFGWNYDVMFESIQDAVSAVSTTKSYRALAKLGEAHEAVRVAREKICAATLEIEKLEGEIATTTKALTHS